MLDNLKNYHVVLASKSPRRQELLRGMGVDFTVLTKDTPEAYAPEMPPVSVPKFLSLQKSLAFSDDELPQNYLLITSDTVVIADSQVLGKPADRRQACAMLRLLSGKTHLVATGVTVRSPLTTRSFTAKSRVQFAPLDDDEINYYVDNCQPFDKAGAYGIQEWIGYVGIRGLSGSYYNVMGLPTQRLYQVLKTF